MAASAASLVSMVTNAKPRGRPLNLSLITSDFDNRAVSAEELLELFLGGVEGKVSNKQFYTHDDFTFRFLALSQPFPTIGSQIITETGSTEDLPGFEIGELSIPGNFSGFPRGRNHYFTTIFTGAPPCFLLASAASMNAIISMVSSGGTGATPVWKNFMKATTSGW